MKSEITKNSTLTYFAKEVGLCYDILGIPVDKKLGTRNICADVFEAIVGVLYYQYGLTNLNRIKNWLFSLQPVSDFFEQESLKQYERSQHSLISLDYIKRMKWNKQDSVKNFFDAYFSRDSQLRLRTERAYGNMFAYFIFNPAENRKFYIDTIPSGEIEELKPALIEKTIWL